MCVEITRAASIVIGRISALAGQDPEFRAALESVLDGLLDTRQAPNDDGAKVEEVSPSVEHDERPQTEPDRDALVMPAESIAAPPAVAPTIQRPPREPVQTDLSAIEARCRLKAEGARWAAERQRQIQEGMSFGTAIGPYDRELIARAKQIGCFLWMNGPSRPQPEDLGLWDVLARCFEMAAEAATLLRECALDVKMEELLRQCLDVAAEAQSALRSAVTAVGAPTDTEQQSLYEWLRKTAAERRVYIERHLRSDDPADPHAWADIQSRIQAVREACRKVLDRERQRTNCLGQIRYHANQIRENGSRDHDWNIIAQAADEIVNYGVPPSNREIREIMLPIIDFAPESDGFPPSFHLVLREARNYLAGQDAQPLSHEEAVPTAEVQAVRRFLGGTSLVLIGGESRDYAEQAIKEAFGLEEVVWLDWREHQSTERFKPYITRSNVRVVALLIRWSSHSYGELKRYCDRYGKLFVRLRSGYSPNQFANRIMAQCGDLLRQETGSWKR
jgi:hypothetical protein